MVKTYNPKQVAMAVGSHIVTGFADDSFITIESNGDGVSKKVGCDGEVVRAINPDGAYKVKLSLLADLGEQFLFPGGFRPRSEKRGWDVLDSYQGFERRHGV